MAMFRLDIRTDFGFLGEHIAKRERGSAWTEEWPCKKNGFNGNTHDGVNAMTLGVGCNRPRSRLL